MEVATASRVSPPAARRGRREKPWPAEKQKKLLRLYVCTQSERLPLVRILELLKDGTFDPRQRNTHKHLKSLLPDRRIDDWRPRDLATMLIRVRFLRSVREERRMRIRKVRRRLEVARSHGFYADESPGVPMHLDQPHPAYFAETPAAIKQPDSPGSTPPGISTDSSATSDTYLRDKSPSRASSTSPSTKSAKRRSWASVLSSISSGISSLARSSSSASSKGVNLNGTGPNTALSKMTREEFLAHLQERPRKAFKGAPKPSTGLFKPKYSNVNPTIEDLNAALVRMCCSAYVGSSPGCVHERLSRAIDAQRAEGPDFRNFTITDEEANMVDKFGNSLLHVAARWGARISLLLLIIRHTDDVQVVNHRGETFLHVYHPPESPRVRPVSFLNLVRSLRSRGYDFCHRDVDKQTFLHHLVAKKEFPIETLYYVFREVGHGAARFLVANKAADGERLWHSIRKNLEKTAPKLHRIFGDEVEFIRRYLPEFSEPNAPATGDTSTCGSDSLISLHPADTGIDPNDSSAQAVRRTPLMKLLRRAASGRGLSEKDLGAKLESMFEVASKQPDFDLHSYLGKRDTEGNTALHYAAEFGIVTAVQFLCTKAASVNVFNNCGNTPLQLVKYAIQRTDVRSDIHMEARYLRCAVLLLEQGAFDQSKLVSERSIIFPYDVFDGSERSISNLVKQGVATHCKGLHLLTSSVKHHAPYLDGFEHDFHQHNPSQSKQVSLSFQTSVL
ncbi:Ankyrin repeat domain-containing protein 2 [Madurella mycetomatis]|uniref:Ankyrin repeat domain-containing protein 2 n=1 Tax=Madurella mycetomatis TaxID=100816 RepID=A0A175WHD2_9PEZI|nr:Ankyrin repeat domain-containing protein 2 [Madurella mycetomatis]